MAPLDAPQETPAAWPVSAKAYELEVRLGTSPSGSSTVWLATCAPDDTGHADVSAPAGGTPEVRRAAVKVVDLEKQSSTSLDLVTREVAEMRALSSAYLVGLHAAFVSRGELWLVMQLHAAGSAADLMRATCPNGFEESTALGVLADVTRGLAYLHSHHVIHRNLKCANLLVSDRGAVRIGDFALAGSLVEHGSRRSTRGTFVGSPQWMAPEILEQSRGYGVAVDIWSLGVTAIELVSGSPPYAGEPPMKVMLRVLQSDPPPPPRGTDAFQSLIVRCLQRDPDERPVAADLLSAAPLSDVAVGECEARLGPIVGELPPISERAPAPARNSPRDSPSADCDGGDGSAAGGGAGAPANFAENIVDDGGWDFDACGDASDGADAAGGGADAGGEPSSSTVSAEASLASSPASAPPARTDSADYLAEIAGGRSRQASDARGGRGRFTVTQRAGTPAQSDAAQARA